MSSILDALNKKRGKRTPLARSDRSDETRPPGPRRGGSGTSPLRIALWVISTVAVGAFTGLFLVYRLAALGLVAKNPTQAPTAAEPGQEPGTAPGPLAAVLKDEPAAPGLSGMTLAGSAHEPASAVPTRPVEPTWKAQPEAVEPSLPTTQRAAVPEQTLAAGAEAPAGERAKRAEPGPTPEAEEFYLTGIMLNAERPMAIINGRLVGVGEQVEGCRVLLISQDGVRLEGQATLLRIRE